MAQRQNKQPEKKPRIIRINLSWLYILLFIGIGFLLFRNSGAQPEKIEWAQVQEMFTAGDIKDIHFIRNDFKGNVTVKADRLDKYATLYPGGQVPKSSPHMFFLVSSKFDPEAEESLDALKANAAVFDHFAALICENWKQHDTLLAFAPDHGCHLIDGGCGSHGLDMPEDMLIPHFYGAIPRS